ncbi:MAG: ribosomal protein L7/L12 [Acidobacteria bacterium]|nr:ribosomal protein L7/L12 [Acidobacteriota bacterium]
MNADAVRDEAARLARAGRKIDAIKLVRERGGLGLKEAKAYVEALDRGPSAPAILPDRPLRSNAEQKSSSNFPLLALLLFLIVLAGYLYLRSR